MYDENSFMVEIDGYDGTYTCTNSVYYNHQWLYEMTNDDDDTEILTVTEDGEIYEEASLEELGYL